MYKNFSKVYDKFMEICDYNEWVSLLESYIKDYNQSGNKILDLGCGIGADTLYLIEKGFNVLSCDFSVEALNNITNTIKDLKKGYVDIVIGTHRLLSKDVQFKDLGLLIIDELK